MQLLILLYYSPQGLHNWMQIFSHIPNAAHDTAIERMCCHWRTSQLSRHPHHRQWCNFRELSTVEVTACQPTDQICTILSILRCVESSVVDNNDLHVNKYW